MVNELTSRPQGSVRASVVEERVYDERLMAARYTEIPSNLQMRVEYNGNGTHKFVGYAARGVSENQNEWLIHYFEYNSSKQVISRTIAYDSWTNRDSANYS